MNKSKKKTPSTSKQTPSKIGVKPKPNKVAAKDDRNSILDDIPIELQQLLLNIFGNSFARPNDRPVSEVVQEVKGHLYNRDFAAAFGKNEYLHAYAARWSASRALGYLKLLDRIFKEYLEGESESNDRRTTKILCLGGGAGAELVALAGILKLRSSTVATRNLEEALDDLEIASKTTSPEMTFEITFVDVADWQSVIDTLYHGTTTAPPLSPYASAAAREANAPLISPMYFSTSFIKADVLTLTDEELQSLVASQHLITLFFTLNELYTSSMPKTQSFLFKLTELADAGTLLLVVDSAGSYSTVSLNGQEKKYPMHWLLDHALLTSEHVRGKEEANVKWEKLQEKESEWFRIPEGLKYPLELENMRYQLHLYRRL